MRTREVWDVTGLGSGGYLLWRSFVALAMLIGVLVTGRPAGGDEPPVLNLEVYPSRLQARIDQVRESFPPGDKVVRLHGVYESLKTWPLGAPIQVCFFGGTTNLRRRIALAAEGWNRAGGNIRLEFGDLADPTLCDGISSYPIRIGFREKGNWSLIGRESVLLSEPDEASLNLENFDREPPLEPEFGRVVLHEFGHALGLHHEHQNPQGPCEEEFAWCVIYKQLKKHLGWSTEMVDHNFRRLINDGGLKMPGEFDSASIMIYPLPDWMYKTRTQSPCFVSAGGYVLSDGDERTIREAYPMEVVRHAGTRERSLQRLRSALLAEPADDVPKKLALEYLTALTAEDPSVAGRSVKQQLWKH